jgi:gamma-glutamyltranspeptidase/glutathione hydrolase
LRLIAQHGADAFYTGPIAEDIVKAVNGAKRNPGAMTMADLAGYEAKRRQAACLFYRLWLACGAPPPSAGGITTLQILGILQRFDLAALEPGSVEAVHLIAEASRLAFADRDLIYSRSRFRGGTRRRDARPRISGIACQGNFPRREPGCRPAGNAGRRRRSRARPR